VQATKEPSNGVWTLNVTVSAATSIVQVDLPLLRPQPTSHVQAGANLPVGDERG